MTSNIYPNSWNQFIASLPDPHLLQTREWAEVKARFGWQPIPHRWDEAAAMVLRKNIPAGGFARRMCILYVPKGPLLRWDHEPLRRRVLDDLQTLSRRQGAIFLKIDPDVTIGTGLPGSAEAREDKTGRSVTDDLQKRGWIFSQNQIQFRNTITLDLSPSEDELLAKMKQKTRYNIRLAIKKGVRVRRGGKDDLSCLYRMYAETSLRDGFAIREEKYYHTVWETFMQSTQPTAEPLIAEVEGQSVAALFLFYFAGRAYYLYGMSRAVHREKMPNHLLQWEAIRRAKAAGCHTYDFWGAPDIFNESDGMWPVYRFKEGFGGQIVRTIGAWDYTPSPLLYQLYTKFIPRLMAHMRSRGEARLRQAFGE